MLQERKLAEVHVREVASIARRQLPRRAMVGGANHNLLRQFHDGELEVRVERNLREVNLAHLVCLIDVE